MARLRLRHTERACYFVALAEKLPDSRNLCDTSKPVAQSEAANRQDERETSVSDGWNERDIVCGLRDGDRDAWSALCEQYSARVWRSVSRMIGSNTTAVEDVFQETMLAVARSGRQIAIDTRIRAWLSRIAHNQAALYWRKRYRDSDLSSLSNSTVTESDDSASSRLIRQETVAHVRRVLAVLDAEYATILTAKYVEGLSVAEIVSECGGSTESVRSRLARARRAFREQYERHLQRSSD